MGTIRTDLKAILAGRGISARELARMAGLSREAVRILVSNEAKHFSAINLAKICAALDVGISDILIYERK